MKTLRPVKHHTAVLLADGDVLIRMPIASYLRDCGYRVIEAANGDEAIVVLIQRSIKVDVLLADVELPGKVNGFGLARWVRERRPAVKVILASSEKRAVEAASELCDEGPFQKRPYEPQAVEDYIRRLLAKRLRR